MRLRLIFLSLILFHCVDVFPQARPVKEIAPGVFYYFGDEAKQMSANCVWIVFREYVLAIDANYPWGAEDILKEIRKTTGKPVRYVFNTHYHHDHTFGNAVFIDSGAVVISTEKTGEEMHTLGQNEWDHGSSYSGRDMKKYRREFPSLMFDKRMVFDDGEHRVELIRMGPAHTAGDGVAYLPKEKILVTGDLFVNGNPWGNNVADANADYEKWFDVLETMASWDVKMVIPGHGDPGGVDDLRNQRAYLKDLFEQVSAGVKLRKSKDQLIKE
ncbi:MAG: MBL fold metallo-hydrolase [Chitinophagaceae bacterium]|nr:MAG: MBL fold metallo-hydrolase [Chitinophagaceae bacterium]